MKVKEESEKKVGLKLNIQKIKIMASGPITSWQSLDHVFTMMIKMFLFYYNHKLEKIRQSALSYFSWHTYKLDLSLTKPANS